jgi:diaminohydroxyphosphoribosylaminopyrimidine deaminase/5-amino-6-(5-phosphoribosylamino)uracil reductase
VQGGRFDLVAVLRLLGERGINEVQVEAGATLAGGFLADGLVDELLLYVAPVMLGERARPMFEGLHIDAMAERLSMRIVESRRIGADVRVLLRPQPAG